MKEKIIEYIKTWEQRCYFDGIPDEAPRELEVKNKVPSYRLICIAIMKNDTSLKTLGYGKQKSIYYSELKYIELSKQGKIKQLKLNL
jgi:predicted phosphoadenosine phosphosulfate sulfurtransferase